MASSGTESLDDRCSFDRRYPDEEEEVEVVRTGSDLLRRWRASFEALVDDL